jgi:NAD+ synthase (glutamine-hydrolysing)
MKLLRIAAAALNQTPLDWDANLANIVAAVDEGRRREVTILCLPELSITGYGCEDMFFSVGVQQMALAQLREIIHATRGMVVTVGLPLMHGGAIYNVVAVVIDAELRGFVAKQRLPGDGLHYEPRWFKPWPENVVTSTEIDDKTIPLGDLLFDVGGVRIGIEVCEDAWVVSRPAADHTRLGADVVLNPSASHFAFGKSAVRERLLRR